jgi:hypothetical protein
MLERLGRLRQPATLQAAVPAGEQPGWLETNVIDA